MGKIIIQEHTTKNPIQMIGEEAGVCWGADINNTEKNYKRGLDCLVSGHGRTWEYPQVYMIIDGYSARVIRELYTHIGGSPTRLQASTRYIDYSNKGFSYVTPPSVLKDKSAQVKWNALMKHITTELASLENDYNIPKEDVAMGLPLGMKTKIIFRTNLRNLIDMSHQRMCTRAYWEYRKLFNDICKALSEYSDEWEYLVDNYFKPKCEKYGFCTEAKSCGRKPKK